MRKLICLSILLLITIAGYSQNVDNFEVGPYEVDYKGEGDFKYRLRKDIDLYKYFGLKKDTLIVSNELAPVKQAFQMNVFMSSSGFSEHGNSNLFGIDGSWKRQIGKVTCINAGLSLGFSYGRYDANHDQLKDMMFEIGIPLSIEFTKLDRTKASLYTSIGVTPLLYNTLKAEITDLTTHKKTDADKENGFCVAPRIDFGGYIPVGSKIMRIGIYGQYKINCSGDENRFKDRIDRAFVGANVGLVF